MRCVRHADWTVKREGVKKHWDNPEKIFELYNFLKRMWKKFKSNWRKRIFNGEDSAISAIKIYYDIQTVNTTLYRVKNILGIMCQTM